MPKATSFISGSVQHSVYQALCARGPHIKKNLDRLLSSVPMPLDAPCLGFVCTAANHSLQAAFALIPDLNTAGQSLLKDMELLDATCKEVYAERGAVDAFDTLFGRKTKFTGWTTLAFLASNGVPITSGRLAAVGMEVGTKLVSADRKLVAQVHMLQLGTGHLDYDVSGEELVKGIHFEGMGLSDVLPWFPRAKKTYFKVLDKFSAKPPPLPPPPTIHERATAQWKAHAAYPNFKQRAGVLDKTTATELQIQRINQPAFCGAFKSNHAFRAALWFDGFSGVTFDALPEIPLAGPECTHWAICLDVTTGLLKRDMSCLSTTMPKAVGAVHCIEANMVSTTPIPEEIRAWLMERLREFPTASQLGDLLPELLTMHSAQRMYPSFQDLPLTWARWARTVGRLMVRQGADGLLTSVITGNFGNCGRSKVHYCAVAPQEIWATCKSIFPRLGFGAPVEMPPSLMHFGSSLVPTHEYVSTCDCENLKSLEQVRKMGKCSTKELFQFHNQFVKSVAFRICCLLALREANPISITANIYTHLDDSIDVDDKSTPGRRGALPIPLCSELKDLINLYFAHCDAMKSRLATKRGLAAVKKWLEAVSARSDVHLLCTIDPQSNAVHAISTHTVLKEHPELARDFGRKLLENHLRLEKLRTRDIDRVLRHENLGQESYTSVNDDSEVDWLERVTPTINTFAQAIFPKPLFGLRKKA